MKPKLLPLVAGDSTCDIQISAWRLAVKEANHSITALAGLELAL